TSCQILTHCSGLKGRFRQPRPQAWGIEAARTPRTCKRRSNRCVLNGPDRAARPTRRSPRPPPLTRLRPGLLESALRADLLQPQQPPRFLQHKIRVHERLVADVLPADAAGGVDQECAMKRHVLKIVVGAIGLEDRTVGVAHQWEFDLLLALERRERLAERVE